VDKDQVEPLEIKLADLSVTHLRLRQQLIHTDLYLSLQLLYICRPQSFKYLFIGIIGVSRLRQIVFQARGVDVMDLL
jgi:hypothetical protein